MNPPPGGMPALKAGRSHSHTQSRRLAEQQAMHEGHAVCQRHLVGPHVPIAPALPAARRSRAANTRAVLLLTALPPAMAVSSPPQTLALDHARSPAATPPPSAARRLSPTAAAAPATKSARHACGEWQLASCSLWRRLKAPLNLPPLACASCSGTATKRCGKVADGVKCASDQECATGYW